MLDEVAHHRKGAATQQAQFFRRNGGQHHLARCRAGGFPVRVRTEIHAYRRLGGGLPDDALKLGEPRLALSVSLIVGGNLGVIGREIGHDAPALFRLRGGLLGDLSRGLVGAPLPDLLAVLAGEAHTGDKRDPQNNHDRDSAAHGRLLRLREILGKEEEPGDAGKDDERDHRVMDEKANLPATVGEAEAGGKGAAVAPWQASSMNLGLLLPELADVESLAERRRHWVRANAYGGAPDSGRILLQYDVLTFDDYAHIVANFDRLAKELRKEGQLLGKDLWAGRRLLGMKQRPREYTPTFQGYVAYLCDLDARFSDEIQKLARPSTFPEDGRKEHTLIVAPTNWGKSELIKALAYHHVQRGDAAVIVLDPGGDLAKQIARWPELGERLVYVEPELKAGMTVGINPLDGAGLDERGRNHVAEILAMAIDDIVAAPLSQNMINLALNCATVLLSVPDATLADMSLMVRPVVRGVAARNKPIEAKTANDARWDTLMAVAQSYRRPSVATFFREEFVAEHYESTRGALRARLRGLLSRIDLEGMIDGPATLRLEDAVNARKVILVNLAKFGPDASAAVGRLLVAAIAGLARRRAELPAGAERVPIHLFVDEASTMVSQQMVRALAELRKYGLHLTLAQQVGGAGFSKEQRDVLFKNTGIKFIGKTDAEFFKLADAPEARHELPKIQRGEFWVQWGHGAELRRLRVRSDLAGWSHGIDDAAWAARVDQQVATWYRPAMPPALPPGRDRPSRPL